MEYHEIQRNDDKGFTIRQTSFTPRSKIFMGLGFGMGLFLLIAGCLPWLIDFPPGEPAFLYYSLFYFFMAMGVFLMVLALTDMTSRREYTIDRENRILKVVLTWAGKSVVTRTRIKIHGIARVTVNMGSDNRPKLVALMVDGGTRGIMDFARGDMDDVWRHLSREIGAMNGQSNL